MWKNTKTGELVGRILSHDDGHVMVENGLYTESEFFATHEEAADTTDADAATVEAGEQSEPATADA